MVTDVMPKITFLASTVFAMLLANLVLAQPIARVNDYLNDEVSAIMALIDARDPGTVRLAISSHPAITSAIVWSPGAQRLFPPTAQIPHTIDQPLLAVESRLLEQAQRASPWLAEKANIDANQWYYCYRSEYIGCVLINTHAVATILDIPDREVKTALHPTNTNTIRSVWGWVLGLVCVCALLVWVALRGRTQVKHHSVKDCLALFTLSDVQVYPRLLKAQRRDLSVDINDRDVKLLLYFYQHPNEVLTKNELYDIAWGRDFVQNSRALEQHIITLRKKLDPNKNRPTIIETVHGHGYRYTPTP